MNSVAVSESPPSPGVLQHLTMSLVISAGIYLATGFVYADPIASVLVGGMIIGTAVPLLVRSGRSLLGAAPQHIDVAGVKEDVERISGVGSVHDLHVWSMGESQCSRLGYG